MKQGRDNKEKVAESFPKVQEKWKNKFGIETSILESNIFLVHHQKEDSLLQEAKRQDRYRKEKFRLRMF